MVAASCRYLPEERDLSIACGEASTVTPPREKSDEAALSQELGARIALGSPIKGLQTCFSQRDLSHDFSAGKVNCL